MNSKSLGIWLQAVNVPVLLLSAASTLILSAGCESMQDLPPSAAAETRNGTNSLVLHAGDTVKVSFPGAPMMDTIAEIRVDGKITLPMVNEIPAANMTPAELQKEILTLAGPQLVVKDVNVSVVSSGFEIYLEGAVLRPGKLVSDRVLTPLEALSDAGIDFQRANLKAIHIVRKAPNGQTENFKLNVKDAFYGNPSQIFVLKPYDIIYVPERFTWF